MTGANERIPEPGEAAGREPDDELTAEDEAVPRDEEHDTETAAPTRAGSNVPNAGKDPAEGRRE
jgi:hypothetical protein